MAKSIEQSYRSAKDTELEEYSIYDEKCPEPTINRYPPTKYLHSLSERLRGDVNDYINTNPHHVSMICCTGLLIIWEVWAYQ